MEWNRKGIKGKELMKKETHLGTLVMEEGKGRGIRGGE